MIGSGVRSSRGIVQWAIRISLFCAAAFTLSLTVVNVNAQSTDYIRAHYEKHEYNIPMRDGVTLFTAVYTPRDETTVYPFLLYRTPYGIFPYGEDHYPEHLGPADEFAASGYIFVYQDIRGRYNSGGQYIELRPHLDRKLTPQDVDDSSDAYDTVEFLLHHVAHNNGKVGLYGSSYPGFFVSASMIDTHPAIKAASPIVPVMDHDGYRGGVFTLSGNFDFYARFLPTSPNSTLQKIPAYDYKTEDGYGFYLAAGPTINLDGRYSFGSNPLFRDQLLHTNQDAYWKPRDLSEHLKNVHCAVLTVTGWYDVDDLASPFKTFHAIERFNPDTPNTLVVGPWTHGGWHSRDSSRLGKIEFDSNTAEYFRQHLQLPFFEYYLKGIGAPLPKAVVFETGSNQWHQYASWPPPAAHAAALYLRPGKKLSLDPHDQSAVHESNYDEYVSDPASPVPFTPYETTAIPDTYMVDDQSFFSKRSDVLTYSTEPLTEDATVVGPIHPHLFISSSGTDSDFIVKLIDIWPASRDAAVDADGSPPGGYQQLVRVGPLRAKFRDSWAHPKPLRPQHMTELSFSLPDVDHTFRKGHRIMVQVQSSWFPLYDRNPQTFTDIPNAKPQDFHRATERIYHRKDADSRIELLILPH